MAVLFEECKCDTSLKDSVSGRKFLYQLVQLITVLEHDGDKDMFCVCAYCVYLSICMHCILSIRDMLHAYIQVRTYMRVCA